MSDDIDETTELETWNPSSYLTSFNVQSVRWSKGFLQSRPERWFPGLSAEWSPLFQSMGIEVQVVRITTTLEKVEGKGYVFWGEVDEAPISVTILEDSVQVMGNALLKVSQPGGREVLIDYLVRRLLGSLVSSWSGPELAELKYIGLNDFESRSIEGVVKIEILLNGRQAVLYMSIGERLVGIIDGLWRRQIRSASQVNRGQYSVRVEIAQLAVSPSALIDYTRSGTSIDLEVPISELMTLKLGNKPWLMVRMGECGGRCAYETMPSPVIQREIPSGTTRVHIEFPSFVVDDTIIVELAQSGAIYVADFPVPENVQLVINGEKVADAVLQMYQGRFAVTVL